MKTRFAILTLTFMALLACAADKPDDLTGANESAFKAHLGQVISLRGRLEMGKEGMCLWWDGPGTNVSFYVVPGPTKSGTFIYPDTWTNLRDHQVRITGELKFAGFPHPPENAPPDYSSQEPPDYYYMVLQRTKIEAVGE